MEEKENKQNMNGEQAAQDSETATVKSDTQESETATVKTDTQESETATVKSDTQESETATVKTGTQDSETATVKTDAQDSETATVKTGTQDSETATVKTGTQDSETATVKSDTQDSETATVKTDTQDSETATVKTDTQDSETATVKTGTQDSVVVKADELNGSEIVSAQANGSVDGESANSQTSFATRRLTRTNERAFERKPKEKPRAKLLLNRTEMQNVSENAKKRMEKLSTAVNDFIVLYEDNHLLVVVKPQNVPVQGDETGDENLLDKLKAYLVEKYNKPGAAYLGLVHRLDRPTGGVMVFAKTSKAAARMCEMIRDGSVGKRYLAVLDGVPRVPSGYLEHYLKKDVKSNCVSIVPSTIEGAKIAKSSYRVLDAREGRSLVAVTLLTGRSHQVRVQMKSLGTPVHGDVKYGEGRGENLALWAYELKFIHPVTKVPMVFVAYPPSIPPWSAYDIDYLVGNEYHRPQ